jgi:hypothetical protein
LGQLVQAGYELIFVRSDIYGGSGLLINSRVSNADDPGPSLGPAGIESLYIFRYMSLISHIQMHGRQKYPVLYGQRIDLNGAK